MHHQRPADAVYLVVEQKDEVFHGSHHELVRAERFDWRQLTPMEQLVPRGQQELQQLAFARLVQQVSQPVPEQLALGRLVRGLVFERLVLEPLMLGRLVF